MLISKGLNGIDIDTPIWDKVEPYFLIDILPKKEYACLS